MGKDQYAQAVRVGFNLQGPLQGDPRLTKCRLRQIQGPLQGQLVGGQAVLL